MHLQKKVHMSVNLPGDKHKSFIKLLIDCIFQAQSQAVESLSFILEKVVDFLFCLIRSCWQAEAGGRPRRSWASSVIGFGSIFDFQWFVLSLLLEFQGQNVCLYVCNF